MLLDLLRRLLVYGFFLSFAGITVTLASARYRLRFPFRHLIYQGLLFLWFHLSFLILAFLDAFFTSYG